MVKIYQYGCIFLFMILIQSCSTSPPVQPENICAIFKEKSNWYDAVLAVKEKWGVPVQVPMAMMYQESSFKADAQPPMEYFFGFIPTGRASSAYGYSQAKAMTWSDYVRETGNSWSSRENFDDAMDFMGWYINKTNRINKISKWDAYNQYLNYHEGWGGYRRKTFKKKNWLMKTAKKVDQRAKRYSAQYKGCKKDLDSDDWLFFL
ncbi:MAG: transglycosylase SLT domain-containing protein [Gammaproteobacteria bacterium]|nr:transglycosylase SLT domain-containing protein [Gammaproteobacteria bacterium]